MNLKLKHVGASAAVIAATAAGFASSSAMAVPLVGLTSSNEIARIETTNIAAATRTAITGLAAGDRLIGIDLRPGNNTIYGVSLSNSIYTINEVTGAATFVAALSSPIINSTLSYGIDFNPMADFTGAASLRLTSSSGNNYAVNATTGAVTTATNIAAGFTSVAYSNSNPLPTTAPTSTSLYYINSANDSLAVATTGFNNPTITTIGLLGVDVLSVGGFDLLGNGLAFAALNVDIGTSLATGIYSINLTTGAATNLGQFNGTLSGLTVSAVPEPESYALMLAGLAAVGFVATRRSRKG